MAKKSELLATAYSDLAHVLNDPAVHTLVSVETDSGRVIESNDVERMHDIWRGNAKLRAEDRALFMFCSQRFASNPEIFEA